MGRRAEYFLSQPGPAGRPRAGGELFRRAREEFNATGPRGSCTDSTVSWGMPVRQESPPERSAAVGLRLRSRRGVKPGAGTENVVFPGPGV